MPIASAGTTANTYLYSGERFDQNVGLYHLRARYYNQGTGRFETMDPQRGSILKPRSLHKYLYAGGDPVNAVDPTGRDILENFSIRAWIFTQITVPLYLQTPAGKATVALGLYAGGLALAETCEFQEAAEELEDLLEPETTVKGPGINCNVQPDEPETE
jgi:RHS repeat-associated protein